MARRFMMKHIRRLTVAYAGPYEDFLNAVWRAFQDLVYAKKQGA